MMRRRPDVPWRPTAITLSRRGFRRDRRRRRELALASPRALRCHGRVCAGLHALSDVMVAMRDGVRLATDVYVPTTRAAQAATRSR